MILCTYLLAFSLYLATIDGDGMESCWSDGVSMVDSRALIRNVVGTLLAKVSEPF